MLNWKEIKRKLWHAMFGFLVALIITIMPPIFFLSF
jgi:hypothetical protein